jgi:hypothetical protein
VLWPVSERAESGRLSNCGQYEGSGRAEGVQILSAMKRVELIWCGPKVLGLYLATLQIILHKVSTYIHTIY